MNHYRAAATYAARGWAVIPLHWITDTGQCSCADGFNPCTDSAGKHPLKKGWTTGSKLSSPDIHGIWVEDTPHANIGIRTGVVSGFFVLDVDPKSGGFDSLANLRSAIGDLPITYVVKTGGGGYHFYFAMPDFPLRNSANRELLKRFGPGLDIRGDGGQVVAAGSRTDKGEYTVQVDAAIATAPVALLDLLRSPTNDNECQAMAVEDLPAVVELEPHEAARVQNYADVTIARIVAEYRDAVPGTGNDTLFRSACSAIEIVQAPWNTYTADHVRTLLRDAARERRAAHPRGGGQDDVEFEQVWRSARNRTVGQGRALPASPSEGLVFDPFVSAAVSAAVPAIDDPFAAPSTPADEIAASTVVTPTVPAQPNRVAVTTAPTVERAVDIEPSTVSSDTADDRLLPTLPAEFYERRPWLKELRRISHERMAAPDSVLGAFLGMAASQIPPGVRLDTTIGSPVTASLYVVLAAPSGVGKSMGASVAKSVYPQQVEAEMLATGEGLVEAFWGTKRVQDPETLKFADMRAQVHTNKFFKMDEGQGLIQLEKRVGNMTGAILRSIWSGDDAGQGNATHDRKRKIAAGSYNLGLVMGMQYEVAGEILSDTSLGTPQRFLWFGTVDPTIPYNTATRPFGDVVDFAPHPSFIRMTPPQYIGGTTPDLDVTPMPMGIDASITEPMRRARWLKVTGQAVVNEHDSQEAVAVCKIAMVIAYISGEDHVTEDTWDLANQVYANSVAVRDALIELAHNQERDKKLAIAHDRAREKQAVNRYGGDQVEATRTVLMWIEEGKTTRRQITQSVKGARRELFADVLNQLVKGGHLKEINAGNRQIRYERVTDWMP